MKELFLCGGWMFSTGLLGWPGGGGYCLADRKKKDNAGGIVFFFTGSRSCQIGWLYRRFVANGEAKTAESTGGQKKKDQQNWSNAHK
jgi:hypothetical protein